MAVLAGALVVGIGVAAAVVLLTGGDDDAKAVRATPLEGSPPAVLDLEGAPVHASNDQLAALARRTLPAGDVRIAVADAMADYGDDPAATLEALRALPAARPEVTVNLGLAELWRGDREAATRLLERTTELDPYGYYGTRADNVLYNRQLSGYPSYVPPHAFGSGTIAGLRQAVKDHPERPDAWLALAVRLQNRDRVAAIAAARRAVELSPTAVSPQVALAVLSFRKAAPSEAFGKLGPLLQQVGENAEIRFHIALLSLWVGLDEQALGQFRQLVREEPDGPYAALADAFVKQLEQRLG